MLLGKLFEKCQLGNPRNNWQHTTEMDPEDRKWVELVLDGIRYRTSVFNLRFSYE
jgi:hypothetical protein